MDTSSSKLASIAERLTPEGLAYVLVVARAALTRSSAHRPNLDKAETRATVAHEDWT